MMEVERLPVAVASFADGSKIAIYEWPASDKIARGASSASPPTLRDLNERIARAVARQKADPLGDAITNMDAYFNQLRNAFLRESERSPQNSRSRFQALRRLLSRGGPANG